MNVVFLSGLVALVLLVPVLVRHYLEHLPFAPHCPACHALTSPASAHAVPARLIPAFAQTVVRRCARCGWKGRMRWRWAPGPARGSL
jgi:hypothetical protein